MGGGRNNGAQADAANAQAMKASQASADLSAENLGEQKQNFNYLFGSGGPGSGTGGSLTPFMDPKSLNVTNPTGVYKTQLTNAMQTIGDSYQHARGSLAQGWANRGGGPGSAPNGFQQDQSRQLERDQANANGTAFGTAVGKQYDDALSNFWSANNIASGQAAGARTGALEGSANSGQTADSIYSTAGQWHPGAAGQIIGAGLQAGGQVGSAAMCPAFGSKVRTMNGDRNAEELKRGDLVLQKTGKYEPLAENPVVMNSQVVRILTKRGRAAKVSWSHGYCVPSGGYVQADAAKDVEVSAEDSADLVESVYECGAEQVLLLTIGGDRTYLCDGIWSLV